VVGSSPLFCFSRQLSVASRQLKAKGGFVAAVAAAAAAV